VNKADGLTCRARVPFHLKTAMDAGALDIAEAMRARYSGERLSSGFVKYFMDGVLDSWTAVMIEDYADRPGWRGEPLFEPERFAALAVETDRRGLQIAVHAIGDGAVRSVLDGYEAARRVNGARDSRHRIEHIEVVHPADIPRFREFGVVASMQPPHPPGSMGLPLEPTVSRIGKARWPLAYAWNTLREPGAELVFATDWPVSPLAPIGSIQAAMIREKWAPDLPDNRQTLHQALDAYTRAGAYVEFMEQRKGRLVPGLLADLVVLTGDLEATAPETLHEVRPRLTICDGVVTFGG
jgi:predicted amidohydrolase YtcJ